MSRNTALAYDYVETDINTASIFEPDVLLPSQFLDRSEEGVIGGERKLMAAMLSDGVESYIEQAELFLKGVPGRLDAIEWVEAKDLSYVFSFDNVCNSLGINPEYLRIGLTRYVKALKESQNSSEVSPKWKKIRRPRKK